MDKIALDPRLRHAADRRTFDDGGWAKVGPSGRGKMLWKMADLLERDLEEFAAENHRCPRD
jgi:acyl-CoA reductase-like NAD-dependent aldehyde dehydrogenase